MHFRKIDHLMGLVNVRVTLGRIFKKVCSLLRVHIG